MNPLANRIVDVFDAEKRYEIDFRMFVEKLSVFAKGSGRDKKMQFAFKVYDWNNDGYIDAEDLFIVLQMMVGVNLTPDRIRQIVHKTIVEADVIDRDGAISYKEFKNAMWNTDIDTLLTIKF